MMLSVMRHCQSIPFCHRTLAVVLSCALCAATCDTRAEGAEPPQPTEQKVRTLFVPFDDLSLILNGPNERVFMTTQEYEALQAEAAKKPPTGAPQPAVVLHAAYTTDIQESVATLRGQLEIEVLDPGLQIVPLVFQGVALRSATLDDTTAPIARGPNNELLLFVRGEGRHQLSVELQTPVIVAAAQQSLQFQLPKAGSTTLNVTVAGNVEVKSGGSVVERQYDPAADQTRFELLPESNVMSLVMSLNNRRLRQGRVVAARSVLVSELTTSYERLHVTAEMRVLHGAVDRFLFDVPAGFQVTGVTSPLLAQWVLRTEAEQEVLEVTLREPTRDTETLNISASRAPVTIGQWTMPQLKPRDVAGHVAVVGLVAESRLRPLGFTADNLIHLDTSVLREALPASVFDTEPGAPVIRQIAAYYAPGNDFSLSATLENPQDELRVATHLLLCLDEQQQTLHGGFTLTPQASKLASFAFQLPADWQLDRLQGADQQPLTYDQYRTADNARFVVKLPQTIQPSESQTVFFEASHSSSSWLTQWDSKQIKFPRVVVEQATDTSGAIAIQANGDLIATPVTTDGLVPLDSEERSRFGLADSSSELTYEVTGNQYDAEFLVQRKQPRISTRNYSFFQVKDGVLVTRHEIVFLIERAHAHRLELNLPDSTPTALSIRGLDDVELKEFSHVTSEGRNHWTVLLAKPQRDTVRLAIDYEQRLDDPAAKDVELPIVRTAGVSYQTQMVSIEGDPALDINVRTSMRRVDVGELAEADYTPGARLLGAFASNVDDETVQISMARRELRALPAAIVKRAELVTLVAARGVSQSSARYLLQTKVPYLALELPPDTELWSVTLNQKPIKPRRRGDQVLLSLQTEGPNEDRDLQVVYQTPLNSLNWLGEVRTNAPQLRLLLDEQDQGALVPQVDLVWHILLPTGYSVSRVRGTVFSNDVEQPESPLKALARAAVMAGGGVYGPPMMLAQRSAAMRMATDSQSRHAAPSGSADDLAALADMDFESSSSAGRVVAEPETRNRPQADPFGRESGEAKYDISGPVDEQPAAPTRPSDQPSAGAADGFEQLQSSPQPQAGQPGQMGDLAGEGQAPRGGTARGMAPGSSGSRYGGRDGQALGYGSGAGYGMGAGGYGGGNAAGFANQQGAMPGMGGGSQMEGAPATGTLGAAFSADGSSMAALVPQANAPAQVAVPGKPLADSTLGKYWALQGLRGLAIQIDRSGDELTFRSLGTDPLLDITVFQKSRMNWLALSVALTIVVLGLLLTGRSMTTRIRFVVLVSIFACGLPLLGGPSTEFAPVFEQTLLAALALIPIWVLFAVIARSWRWLTRRLTPGSAAAASALILIAFGTGNWGSTAQAQDLNELLRPLLEEVQPIRIPDDAVVVPYDPDDVQWRNNATKVLVPYQRYVELWNQAHPDRKIGDAAPQQPFAFAGAQYEVVLDDGEQVLLKGKLAIEIFSDQPVDVPLALADGVITSALLDGQPARLKTIAATPAPAAQQQQPAQQALEAPPSSMLTLLVEGVGRHELELAVRVAITRQGGWRTARATLPYAEATSVALTVPEEGTSVRHPLGTTVLTETAQAAGQTLASTLQAGGLFDVTWRAKISPGSVDQALTADSSALIDVREDGVRVVWQVKLTFGQTERGTFRLEVPSDYLVEKVDGSNVRGWDTQQQAEQTFLTVELLKAVKQQEEMVIHLSRRAAMTSATPNTFTAPVVAVPDAALHRGTIQIRRSPILELQTSATSGVSRTDGTEITTLLEPMLGEQKSPLGVRDYQAYQFNATPYSIALSATQIHPKVTARLRTILRIGETESTLESEIQISPERRAIYLIELAIPADLRLEKVSAAGLTDWSLIKDQERPLLRAFFSAGHTEPFAFSIEGKLNDHTADQLVALPQLEVLAVDQQRGSIVVQVDRSLDARAVELAGCQGVLLERVISWLNEEQRPLARIGLEYSGTTYSGKVQLTPRAPRVVCDTVTNVRVTYRDIQETVLLDFNIVEAGVRQIRFRLPSWLRDANITAPRTRQKTVTPVDGPIAGQEYVQVQLDLQDAITGQYRVVIENDRAITPGRQLAPLPLIEAGTLNNRYVTLENAGRDEIVIDGTPGMEAVNRQSRQWDQLIKRLQGGDFSTAYVATGPAAETAFGYQTKQRAMVVTAGATIGLARTELVVDASGAYRASMLLKVDNRTEPYLEIRLPDNAQLWTAHVAGSPVKPARSVGGTDDALLRIPLIKTAEGDLDYDVVLKYAGHLDQFHLLNSVQFPVIRTENINIESSQVKLHLPDEYRWYQFEGTATRVTGEEDFDAGFVAYQTQQVDKLTQIIRSSNQFSQSRAIFNVKKLGQELQSWRETGKDQTRNDQLRLNLDSNGRVLEAATQEIKELEQQELRTTDNRDILNSFYEEQQNKLSRNSVTRLYGNFAAPTQPAKPSSSSSTEFNQEWFMRSPTQQGGEDAAKTLDVKSALEESPAKGKKDRLQQEQSYRVQQQFKMPDENDVAQKVFQGQAPQNQPADSRELARNRRLELGTKAELNRAYMDKIQQQDQQQAGQNSIQFIPQSEDEELSRERQSGITLDDDSVTQVVAGRTGLSSLDFQLPERGQVFYFTTPRGEVEITARPIEREMGDRLVSFGWLLAMIVALIIGSAIVRRVSCSRTGRVLSVVLLCGGGLLMILGGFFPIFGAAMFFGSILLALDWRGRTVAV